MIASFVRGLAAAIVLLTAAAAGSVASAAADPANTLVIELKGGKVEIALRPDIAPKHVARVKQLAKEGYYNGVVFHRVIPGFMAQTGDHTGTGTGGSKYGNLPAEFSREAFKFGTVGAARTSDPNTANSQFFICYEGCGHLNGQYTIWGQVTSGMELVKAIPASQAGAAPEKMLKVYVKADARS